MPVRQAIVNYFIDDGGVFRNSLKIVHAPTNRIVKGTKYILEAVEKLKEEGYDFDFILVEKKTHDEAMKIYEDADIIIDQLTYGFTLFSIESMAMGKPVLTYIREDLIKYYPDLPIISTHRDNINENLKLLIENADLRKELGVKGRK